MNNLAMLGRCLIVYGGGSACRTGEIAVRLGRLVGCIGRACLGRRLGMDFSALMPTTVDPEYCHGLISLLIWGWLSFIDPIPSVRHCSVFIRISRVLWLPELMIVREYARHSY